MLRCTLLFSIRVLLLELSNDCFFKSL